MFLSLHACTDAINDFFRHENQCDLYLIKVGFCQEQNLYCCLPGMPPPGKATTAKEASVIFLNMAAVIHIVKPQNAIQFEEYTQTQLLPYLESQLTEDTT